MDLTFVRAGMLTTVQDLGRTGHRAAGVPLSGAMDAFALRLANLLVGNVETAAALELTLIGPEVVFSDDALIAVTGAEFPGLPTGRPFYVRAGRSLKFGAASKGCRGYLAVAGGLEVTPVLGSCATNLRDGFGGYEGRALHDGDVVQSQFKLRKIAAHWHIDPSILPRYSASPTVHVVGGAQAEEFGSDWLGLEFKVTPHSDRMGLRLVGAELKRQGGAELLSSAVAPGTVQVPPDGQPIVLMADAQTIGGYPQLAHVISVDLSLVAQLRPGDTIRFLKISSEEAHQRLIDREHVLALLQEGIAQKMS
jgi:antagonist of KipI